MKKILYGGYSVGEKVYYRGKIGTVIGDSKVSSGRWYLKISIGRNPSKRVNLNEIMRIESKVLPKSDPGVIVVPKSHELYTDPGESRRNDNQIIPIPQNAGVITLPIIQAEKSIEVRTWYEKLINWIKKTFNLK